MGDESHSFCRTHRSALAHAELKRSMLLLQAPDTDNDADSESSQSSEAAPATQDVHLTQDVRHSEQAAYASASRQASRSLGYETERSSQSGAPSGSAYRTSLGGSTTPISPGLCTASHDLGSLKLDSRDTCATTAPASAAEVPAWMQPFEVDQTTLPELSELRGSIVLHSRPTEPHGTSWCANAWNGGPLYCAEVSKFACGV